ncbi:acetyltransferase [Halothermothrix orenii]|uniref:Transferase hexapeptide repeat protein n=1 Tax=Halothermothrix orenii (strain H 168 / OCM 544 / DSM 9562) TaxID=373903 RepID=B8CYS6_HALOH|nr:acetyltransferase [Halothermothrix orenii]ACL70445.1 transferase hexapeptide repeat protein [Halothermothrix orenii H 168]
MKNIIIIGAGGHGKVVADIILQRRKDLGEDIKIKGFLDDNFETKEVYYLDIPVLGTLDEINKIDDHNTYFIIAIGDNLVRENIAKSYQVKYYTAIHPEAIISSSVKIGEGTVVMANAVINSCTHIGKHCIINTGSIVEHDNVIDDYVHISPDVALAGNVKVGKRTWIGIGTSVIQGITIGSDTIIGAGSVVVNDIGDNKKAFGVPCKER